MTEQFTIKFGSFIRSVSIIFYHEKLGFLLCNEDRKDLLGNKTLNSHIVGGKVEMDDTSPLQCGLREFCEETNFRTQGESIEFTIQKLIDETNNCKKLRHDLCVSPKKGLYNRFYIININGLTSEFRTELLSFIETPLKKDSPVNSIFWWKRGEIIIEKSSLLESLLKILPSDEKLE